MSMEETGKSELPPELSGALLCWYDINKRNLPWREDPSPYHVWISEIMLQQTRVEAVKPYYSRFLEALPDIKALADCPEEKLMKLWEGLGYYSRVRNMQAAARQIMGEFKGILPEEPDQLKKLKGIGSYTAGAIASIAYGKAVPAVDGNVLRVISRVTNSTEDILDPAVRRRIEKQLGPVLPKDRPGDFNQALMDLGAMICLPDRNPVCTECPLRRMCMACISGKTQEIPVRRMKNPRRIEERTVLVIQDGSRTVIRKRPARGLLAGMYELPSVDGYKAGEEILDFVKEIGLEPLYIKALPDARHVFTHLEWRMKAWLIRVAALEGRDIPGILFADKNRQEKEYAMPSAFRAYIKYMKEDDE